MGSRNTITDLNFDILILILEEIESIDDQINFARAHPNFKNAFEYYHRSWVQSEICFKDKENHILLTHWRFILEWWGPSVLSIDNEYNHINSENLVEAAAEFCPNLEIIHFVIEEESNFTKFENNIPKLRMLKDIRITCNYFIPSNRHSKNRIYINKLIGTLQNLNNLHKLSFGNYYLKRKERLQLDKLTQLEELRIGGIEDEDVKDLLNLFGCLRSLKVDEYPLPNSLVNLANQNKQLNIISTKIPQKKYDNYAWISALRGPY